MKTLRKILLSSLLISGCLNALPVHAADVRLNCDLRVLNLNEPQRNQIRVRRQMYKTEQHRIRRERQNQFNNQLALQNFFSKSAFDTQQAGQIAKQRYEDDMRQTVAELNFYHDIFQLLTPEQKNIWFRECVSPNAGHI